MPPWVGASNRRGWTAGMPESALAAAQAAAQAKELEGYHWLWISLHTYRWWPTVTTKRYVKSCTKRAHRASDRGPNAGKWDNTGDHHEQLKLRHEIARMLGFSTYSEKSLSTKMAETSDQVLGFLNDLAVKAKPQGEREVEELRQFAEKEFGVSELNLWDIAYYSEKQNRTCSEISDEELRPVSWVERSFWFVRSTKPCVWYVGDWSVKVWIHGMIQCVSSTSLMRQAHCAASTQIYTHVNTNVVALGWTTVAVVALLNLVRPQTPVAYLTCNFNKPVGNKPALFTHDEVVTLFHEFGHGIHHMLTQVDAGAVSGINGVPWDAVELPSQFLETGVGKKRRCRSSLVTSKPVKRCQKRCWRRC